MDGCFEGYSFKKVTASSWKGANRRCEEGKGRKH